MPKNLIPLSELPSADEYDSGLNDGRIFWDVELPPHIDAERILLDAGHMHRLQTLGCFSLNYFYSYQGKTTQYEPTITGMNPDGTAIAGRKASMTKRAEESREVLKHDIPVGVDRYNYYKTTATHGINRSELSQSVSDRLSSGRTRSEYEVWASELDEVTQQSIRHSAYTSLIGDTPLKYKVAEAFMAAVVGGWISLDIAAERPDLATELGGIFIVNRLISLGNDTLRNKRSTGETHLKERRWSLFEDIQPDRYVALSGLTRINSLIKYRK